MATSPPRRRPAEQRRARARELGEALRASAPPAAAAGCWLRAIRRHRGLGQRDLAEQAAIPRSTIVRIEAGAVVPRLDTVLRLLAVTGYDLALVDHRGRPITLDTEHERLRDGRGRHFPAHLTYGATPRFLEWNERGRGWWGWERIAWLGDDWVPEHTFWARRKHERPQLTGSERDRGEHGRVWDDAT